MGLITVKKCPRCKLLNPDEAMSCDCGYSFADAPDRAEKAPFFGRVKKMLGSDPEDTDDPASNSIAAWEALHAEAHALPRSQATDVLRRLADEAYGCC